MSEVCVKCGDNCAIILIGTNGKFCKDCFEKYFSHKFRASLGKNPVVRHGERVAVAFSGGNNSSALLNLLLDAMSPNAFKKLKFHPGIIFVDETTVLPDGNYSAQLEEVGCIMRQTGLPFNIVKLEEALKYHEEEGLYASPSALNSNPTDRLKGLFDSMGSITCKEELLYRMRCKLLSYTANDLGYHHVFLGETSSRLAVNILSNIAQGRGAHLPLDTGFSDVGRFGVINLLRPLRDMTAKEITVYNSIHKVSTVFFPTFSTKCPRNASIQRLTEDFVVTLSVNFPSTETTVYRTSNKLQLSKNARDSENAPAYTSKKACQLCCGPLDTTSREDQAMASGAMNFTELLCGGQYGVPENPQIPTSTKNIALDGMEDMSSYGDPVLCHACTIVKKDLKSAAYGAEQTFSQLLTPTYDKLTENELKMKLKDILLTADNIVDS